VRASSPAHARGVSIEDTEDEEEADDEAPAAPPSGALANACPLSDVAVVSAARWSAEKEDASSFSSAGGPPPKSDENDEGAGAAVGGGCEEEDDDVDDSLYAGRFCSSRWKKVNDDDELLLELLPVDGMKLGLLNVCLKKFTLCVLADCPLLLLLLFLFLLLLMLQFAVAPHGRFLV